MTESLSAITPKLRESAILLLRQGERHKKIAAILGIRHRQVRRLADKLRRQGELSHYMLRRMQKLHSLTSDQLNQVGSIADILSGLTPEQQARLWAEKPQDMTLAEYIAAIVRDQLEEEQ